MLLNLLKRPRRITSNDFAQMLWKFSCLGSLRLYDHLKPHLVKMGYDLSKEEDARLFREIAIANLWTVHKSLPSDENVLCSLHQMVASGCRNLADAEGRKTTGISFTETELQERYARYDSACDENSGGPLILGMTMVECMLPSRQHAWLDATLGFLVIVNITHTIKALLRLRTQFRVVD